MDKNYIIMNSIVIEKPTLDDVDTMFIWGEATPYLWATEETKWYPKDSIVRWITDPKDDALLVARVNGKLAGMCMTNVLRDWALCTGLYVDEPYRKKGVGKKLIEEATYQLQKKGIPGMDLVVEVDNPNAVAFYKSCGFVQGYMFHWMYKPFTA